MARAGEDASQNVRDSTGPGTSDVRGPDPVQPRAGASVGTGGGPTAGALLGKLSERQPAGRSGQTRRSRYAARPGPGRRPGSAPDGSPSAGRATKRDVPDGGAPADPAAGERVPAGPDAAERVAHGPAVDGRMPAGPDVDGRDDDGAAVEGRDAHGPAVDGRDPQGPARGEGAAGSPTSDEPEPKATAAQERGIWRNLLGARGAASSLHRLLVATALTVLLLLLAWFGPDGAPSRWLQLAVATPVVLWCGWPYHRAAVAGARHRAATTDALVSLGIAVAYLHSVVGVLADWPEPRVATGPVVTCLLLAARGLEARAQRSATQVLRSLQGVGATDVAVLRIDPVTRITGETRIPIGDLVVGDQFIARPGEPIAADGIVLDGSSMVDPSRVTGEAPAQVVPGDPVIGGATMTTGRLVVAATRVGPDTMLAAIRRMLAAAQAQRAPAQRTADRVGALLVPVAVAVAVVGVTAWLATGHGLSSALTVAVAVLVVAGSAAPALATSSALALGAGRAARLGALLRGPDAATTARRVDTIVLAKTGTVTTGRLRLRSIAVAGQLPKAAALKAAAAVEQGMEQAVEHGIEHGIEQGIEHAVEQGGGHPVARAILDGAKLARIALPHVQDVTVHAGQGVSARIRDTTVTVGAAGLFATVDPALRDHAATHPGTTVFVGWDGEARAALTMQDPVRDSSRAAIDRLRGLGLTPHLLTADAAATAGQVAEQAGIRPDLVHAEVAPAAKAELIAALQRQGRVVAVVGDGGADAAALARADLALAMRSGFDAAAGAADIVVVRPDLDAVAAALEVSRAMARIMRQNVGWVIGYPVVALATAAAGLLDPVLAGVAMALSSVPVLVNSRRLRRSGRR